MLIGDRRQVDCALCRQSFPVEFLIAAHIKRRSLCTDEERLDIKNVAMLACVFGCDDLFEAGYIAVSEQGHVLTVTREPRLHGPVARHLDRLARQRCSAHSQGSAKYFTWHRDNIFRGFEGE